MLKVCFWRIQTSDAKHQMPNIRQFLFRNTSEHSSVQDLREQTLEDFLMIKRSFITGSHPRLKYVCKNFLKPKDTLNYLSITTIDSKHQHHAKKLGVLAFLTGSRKQVNDPPPREFSREQLKCNM